MARSAISSAGLAGSDICHSQSNKAIPAEYRQLEVRHPVPGKIKTRSTLPQWTVPGWNTSALRKDGRVHAVETT